MPAELQVSNDFRKRKVYKLVNKANGADFVCLVLSQDNVAEGLARAPEVFKEYQNKLNIEALREAAYARAAVAPLKIHNLGIRRPFGPTISRGRESPDKGAFVMGTAPRT
jgi:hypothetical protein